MFSIMAMIVLENFYPPTVSNRSSAITPQEKKKKYNTGHPGRKEHWAGFLILTFTSGVNLEKSLQLHVPHFSHQ